MSYPSAFAIFPSSCLILFSLQHHCVHDFHNVKSRTVYLASSCPVAPQDVITVSHSTGSIICLDRDTVVSLFPPTSLDTLRPFY